MLRPGRGGGSLPSHGMNGTHSNGYNHGGGTSLNYGGSFDNGDYKDKKTRRNSYHHDPTVRMIMHVLSQPMAWACLLAVLLMGTTVNYRSSRNSILKTLNVSSAKQAKSMLNDLKNDKRRLETELRTARGSEQTLQAQLDERQRELRQMQKERDELVGTNNQDVDNEEKRRLAAREDAWRKQVTVLQQATSRESRRAVTEKFGPGPHHVQIGILLPQEESSLQYFYLEMAPLESMPHAVHLFLEQVDHGLWNNAWFYLNGPHVLQAGPQVEDGQDSGNAHEDDDRSSALRPFRELQLDKLAFPEYSEDFPHLPLTLGYTGRPGGPDFYINKLNNTIGHGPGGQYQHALDEFGDSCFAKVVDGLDVLHRAFRSPTIAGEPELQWFLEEPIRIVSAVIMKELPPLLKKKQGAAASATSEEDTLALESKDDEKPDPGKEAKPGKQLDDSKVRDSGDAFPAARRKPRRMFSKPKIDHQVEP